MRLVAVLKGAAAAGRPPMPSGDPIEAEASAARRVTGAAFKTDLPRSHDAPRLVRTTRGLLGAALEHTSSNTANLLTSEPVANGVVHRQGQD